MVGGICVNILCFNDSYNESASIIVQWIRRIDSQKESVDLAREGGEISRTTRGDDVRVLRCTTKKNKGVVK